MKKLFIAAIALLLVASCNKPAAVVNLALKEGVATNVELYKLALNRLTLVDSLSTNDNGQLKYKIALDDAENPAFYYFFHNATKLAGLVAAKGDRISISADTLGRYSVEGSEDCRLLQEMDARMAESTAKMERILAEAPEDENLQLSKVYIDHKRAMLRQVIENPYSITSAAALFQKFNDQLYVFQEPTDVFVFEKIRDSLATVYPKSEYVSAITKAIENRKKVDKFAQMVSEAPVVNLPEVKMNDVNGAPHALSELEGKVILLSFWSIVQDEHKVFNLEMLPVYNKYHDRGFEIYQICLDVDKAAWASIVRNQNLPWICVNDGLGINSPAVATYNLNSVPTMFIFDRDGEVVARDIYDPDEIDKIIAGII
ncbi:MAG: TlpA family protein disulfide reductase [Bacteroidales bacterium]|nr:TlpA family protein disulfide reductase [Bacteroidales bacterium]